ncbi:MAG: penicillin acylase family protein [Pseudomonadota bacterium]
MTISDAKTGRQPDARDRAIQQQCHPSLSLFAGRLGAVLSKAPRPLVLALMAVGLSSCSLLTPLPQPTSIDERLAVFPTENLPLERPVTIRWNPNQIPFVEAETDADAAFAMGMAHAHLRLGQMAVVRRIIQGRISEMAGPPAADLDAAIRTIDFYRPADAIYAAMPAESRLWADRFVEGVNTYAARLAPDALPHEFSVLAIEWEPWRPQDAIALSRAGGIDLNWEFLLTVLAIEDAALRERVITRVLDQTREGSVTFDLAETKGRTAPRATLRAFAAFAALTGRSGSNSIVVAPSKSRSGAALIANDPHLAFLFPNAWVIAGLKSPSYEMVGMMVPGTPVFGFGRNRTLAWGGTNLRARSSQFVDVSGLPDEAIEAEREDVGVRFWFDDDVTVRRTAYGPIVTDLDLVGDRGVDIAIRWTGHRVTDEVTALLQAMRSSSVVEFQEAIAGFAFPPQTFLAADGDGRIAAVVAAKVPGRAKGASFDIVVTPEQSDRDWQRFVSTAALPAILDPREGFLASANNRPAADGARPFGGIFPQDERIRRLDQLLSEADDLTLGELAAIQLDTVSLVSLSLIDEIRDDLLRIDRLTPTASAARETILTWDGAYDAEAAAPAVFEAFLTAFTPAVYQALGREGEGEIYAELGRSRVFLQEDLRALNEAALTAALREGLTRAAITQARGTLWGDLHQLKVAPVLGQVPLLGARYEIATIPISGSRETIMKSDHDLTDERHDSFFGAQSRHLSDLSDPDANFFVLLGGQDGWLNSDTFADQVELWRSGGTVQVPLTRGARERLFGRETRLQPLQSVSG